MKPKAAKPKARKAPSLAAAKHLRTLFESAAVRQKAHDASNGWKPTASGTWLAAIRP